MEADSPDEQFAAWMIGNLERAAAHFGLTITGSPVLGWRLRSVGAPVAGPAEERWLRVVSQETEWASGDHWTGTVDADMITGIARPEVLDVVEWEQGRSQGAEVATLLPGEPCSHDGVLRRAPDLPEAWWHDLRRAVDVLADVPTTRTHADQVMVEERIRQRFGADAGTTVTSWVTVHGDLHWGNLLHPEFALLDWELWGRGPAGLDAATLYLFSLGDPATARRVWNLFADELAAPDGRIAQLYVAARILRRTDGGDFPDLAAPVRAQVRTVLDGR